jgi:predicted transcriptional regulator
MEVYSDVLKAIGSGAQSPTQIMLKANVSWNVVKSSLQTLVQHGTLETSVEDGRSIYQLTSRGFELLKKLVLIREQMSEVILV